MKNTSGWANNGNIIISTNESGFTGFPGGCRGNYGTFSFIGFLGYWWSSSEDRNNAWSYSLSYWVGYVIRNSANKGDGLSVRCLRD